MRSLLIVLAFVAMSSAIFGQTPPLEPGVSHELAKWRAARYSDVRYKLNLTLEKMSPVLKGTIEIRVKVAGPAPERRVGQMPPEGVPIILDWRSIAGHERDSVISSVTLSNDLVKDQRLVPDDQMPIDHLGGGVLPFQIKADHLIFTYGVVAGENVIKMDFTSPILTSGSAITRYVDKEDGAEYIYSLFVPSDASTAFPVFDQPDLKARFQVSIVAPLEWQIVSNEDSIERVELFSSEEAIRNTRPERLPDGRTLENVKIDSGMSVFRTTRPISTYIFAFAAGPWEKVSMPGARGSNLSGSEGAPRSQSQTGTLPTGRVTASGTEGSIYVRKSQAAKFKPHAAEVFRLNREAVKYFEQYFDYRFPFPKYDLVLIPEFPFGGMEHAGATFLREASIIFPQEPTKNDLVSRATLIFHETAHQWFGDTVTMRWFDDLWLKEGFATFTAYKALEKIMPEMNAWKVFYERIKQGAYQTDSTRGTTAIYQPIANLSAAKSAYGNIVYNKAPAFLRQAEFYLGEDKFQTAVRAFLKKHEFGNAGWEDLVTEFEAASGRDLKDYASKWVTRRGLPMIKGNRHIITRDEANLMYMSQDGLIDDVLRPQSINVLVLLKDGQRAVKTSAFAGVKTAGVSRNVELSPQIKFDGSPVFFRHVSALIPNYGDYGYGIFLLDEKSRDYVLKNIQNEKDPFLRTMMWGALWDSVREGELDPRVFVELVVKVLQKPAREQGLNTQRGDKALAQRPDKALADAQASASDEDESTVATLLGRTGTALNYYIDSMQKPDHEGGLNAQRSDKALAQARASASEGDLRSSVEELLIERMQNAPTLGQRITYYRAFLNIAASEKARRVLKQILTGDLGENGTNTKMRPGTTNIGVNTVRAGNPAIPVKAKDKFDIVTRLLILGDPEAEKLLAGLERTETGDDAKRYAYAARAGIGTAANKAKYWNDFVNNKDISESWIEAAFGPWNSIRHADLTLPYLQKALQSLPDHKRNRKIFFVNGWLGAFVGGQRSEEALAVVNKFLAENPSLDNDLRLKVLENVDIIERAVKIRKRYPQ